MLLTLFQFYKSLFKEKNEGYYDKYFISNSFSCIGLFRDFTCEVLIFMTIYVCSSGFRNIIAWEQPVCVILYYMYFSEFGIGLGPQESIGKIGE